MERRIPGLGWYVTVNRKQPRPLTLGVDAERGTYLSAIDEMTVNGRNLDSLASPKFTAAYRAGMNTGQKMGFSAVRNEDLHIEWRAYVCCWAAQHALHLEGDFVECGVNTGMYAKAICEYTDFGALDRTFYLFDTFQGIPPDQMSDAERQRVTRHNELHYEDCFDLASDNFAPYPNVTLVRGRVPDTLTDVQIDQVAYLSIDMNIAEPEVAALTFFWDRLVPGALVVLDDYGSFNCRVQYDAMNALAEKLDVSILTLPTGQGLIIRP